MKKLVAVLVILALAVPSMAATTVSCAQTGSTTTSATFVVAYSYDNVGSFPRAFALDISTNLGTFGATTASTPVAAIKTGESTTASKGYGIFPGTIAIDSTGSVTSYGSPLAPDSDLPSGTNDGAGTAGITVELGSLYATTAAKPTTSGQLVTVTLNVAATSAAARTATITIVPNVARGGIVLEDATSAGAFSNTCTVVIPAAATGPQAWQCAAQGLGDTNGDGKVNASDLLLLKQCYGATSRTDPKYNCKADFTRDQKINASDLLRLKQNYGVTNLTVCGSSTMTCVF